MADASPPPSTTEGSPDRNPPLVPADVNQRYWCYSCERSVMVDRVGGEILCGECRNGFVEAIVVGSRDSVELADVDDDVSFGEAMSQMLRFIAEASINGDADVDPIPQPHPDLVSDVWHNGDQDEEEEDEEEEAEEGDEDEFDNGEQIENGEDELNIENDENSRDEGGMVDGQEREEDEWRRRQEALRLRLRGIASRANSRITRISDWVEIMRGLHNRSNELRMELPETDGYFGNPEDYVDEAGYEALLQNLAESDQSGRRGAPAAAKASVAVLPTVVITDCEWEACAICKDGVNVGDSIKKMPCGHGYHEDCIVPWLESRNSCPVCRYELPTDDPEYEEQRKKKFGASASRLI